MINLDEAFERAALMCDDSLYLGEQSYELLVDKISDEDLYPFTMGLVERGIIVKHSSKRVTDKTVADKLVKAAQAYKQSPGGVWMPDTWEDTEEEPVEEVEDGEYESFLESTPFTWQNEQSVPDVGADVDNLRSTLENAGLRITDDGKVEMYAASIPGIYTDKLPQGPLPLETAVKYFDQLLDATDSEQAKLDGLQDLLTRLTNQTSEVEASIEALDNYNYSSASRSQASQDIANGLQEVRGLLAEGNWTAAQRVLGELTGSIEVHLGERYDNYDENLAVVDALDQLAELQEANPQGYQQAIQGLGGMPLAAQRVMGYSEYDEAPDWQTDAYRLEFAISDGYLQRIVTEVLESIQEDNLNDPNWVVPKFTVADAQDLINTHKAGLADTGELVKDAQIDIYWANSQDITAELEASFQGKSLPVSWDQPPEWEDFTEEYDLSDDESFSDGLVNLILWYFEGFQRLGTLKMGQLNEPEFMIPVESSNVQAFGYVEEDQTLFVDFLAKGNSAESRYVYYEVEPETYSEFMASPSKGKFIWTHLRDRYQYEKLW